VFSASNTFGHETLIRAFGRCPSLTTNFPHLPVPLKEVGGLLSQFVRKCYPADIAVNLHLSTDLILDWGGVVCIFDFVWFCFVSLFVLCCF